MKKTASKTPTRTLMTNDRTLQAAPGRIRHVLTAAAALAILASPPSPAAAQGIGMEELHEMMSWGRTSLVLVDKLEAAPGIEDVPIDIAGQAWYGSAYGRLWLRLKAEQLLTSAVGAAEAQVMYGRLVAPFWDALIGARLDRQWSGDSGGRAHLVLGLTGLAPFRFDVSPTLFVSHEGDISARMEVEYQLLITQRLIAEPEMELDLAIQDVPEWGVESGISGFELGLRLRYEIVREFAPYAGVTWVRGRGGTTAAGGRQDERAGRTSMVVGIRMWR